MRDNFFAPEGGTALYEDFFEGARENEDSELDANEQREYLRLYGFVPSQSELDAASWDDLSDRMQEAFIRLGLTEEEFNATHFEAERLDALMSTVSDTELRRVLASMYNDGKVVMFDRYFDTVKRWEGNPKILALFSEMVKLFEDDDEKLWLVLSMGVNSRGPAVEQAKLLLETFSESYMQSASLEFPDYIDTETQQRIKKELAEDLVNFLMSNSSLLALSSVFSDKVRSRIEALKFKPKAYKEVFKAAKIAKFARGENVDFEEILNSKYEMKLGQDLAAQEITQMQPIYMNSYPVEPENPADKQEGKYYYPSEFRDSLVSDLVTDKDKESRYYLLKDSDGKIIGFSRFRDRQDMETGEVIKEFGAFNLNSDFTQAYIGDEMMKQFINAESVNGESIHAVCNPNTVIARKYLQAGLVGTKLFEYKGVWSLELVKHSGLNDILETELERDESTSKVLETIKSYENSDNRNIRVVKFLHDPSTSIKIDLVNEDFFLTRMALDKTKNLIYCLLEKHPADIPKVFFNQNWITAK